MNIMEPKLDNFQIFDGTIQHPSGHLVFGPVYSGKSAYIKTLIDNRRRIMSEEIHYIYYFYGEESQTVRELQNEEYVHDNIFTVYGIPEDFEGFIKDGSNCLFIFDDLMQSVVNSSQITDLVTKKCQHRRVSWIITLQNAFHRGPERLNITRSAHYITVFDSPLDSSIASTLASKILPDNRRAFLDIYREATSSPFSYLFCDGRQGTPEDARLRSGIIQEYQTAYIPRKSR